MNKTDREYLKTRINQVVKCTNESIATSFNKRKKNVPISDTEKYDMIRSGKATLKDLSILTDDEYYNRGRLFDHLMRCFDYPLTSEQKDAVALNIRLQDRCDAIMLEVELEGKRLLDDVVFGVIMLEEVTKELHKIGGMVNLAK